jgi:hypothetical protein
MMNCTGFYEDTLQDFGVGESVNNKPVVAATESLINLIKRRSGTCIISGYYPLRIRWTREKCEKFRPDSIFRFSIQIPTIYNFFLVTGKESAVIGFKKKVQSDRENLSYTIFFKDASS